jgi:hypothetical protein
VHQPFRVPTTHVTQSSAHTQPGPGTVVNIEGLMQRIAAACQAEQNLHSSFQHNLRQTAVYNSNGHRLVCSTNKHIETFIQTAQPYVHHTHASNTAQTIIILVGLPAGKMLTESDNAGNHRRRN